MQTLDLASNPASPAALSRAGRTATLVYGVVAYALFLATFVYAFLFTSGFDVPWSVDAGQRASLGEALVVDALLLGLFAVQHTVMARIAFKRWWTKLVPAPVERSTFVLATCAVLWLLFLQWRHIPGTLWELSGPAAWFLRGVSILGWALVLLTSFLIDHFELFGLRQTFRGFRGLSVEPPRFRERWLYRRVRHPLMLGFLIAFWSTPQMTMGHLFFAAMVTGYILVGIQVEERTLVAEHGKTYLDYRGRVPMLFPKFRGSGGAPR